MNNIKLKNSLNLKFFCEIKGDNYKIDVTDCVYKKCLYFDKYIYILTRFNMKQCPKCGKEHALSGKFCS